MQRRRAHDGTHTHVARGHLVASGVVLVVPPLRAGLSLARDGDPSGLRIVWAHPRSPYTMAGAPVGEVYVAAESLDDGPLVLVRTIGGEDPAAAPRPERESAEPASLQAIADEVNGLPELEEKWWEAAEVFSHERPETAQRIAPPSPDDPGQGSDLGRWVCKTLRLDCADK